MHFLSSLPKTDLLPHRFRFSTSYSRPMSLRKLFERWIPQLVLGPTLLASLLFVYGFIFLTGYISLTESRLMPNFEFAGLVQYQALFDNERWWTSLSNLGI